MVNGISGPRFKGLRASPSLTRRVSIAPQCCESATSKMTRSVLIVEERNEPQADKRNQAIDQQRFKTDDEP